MSTRRSHCRFIPPYLIERLAFSDVDVEISRCGHATLAIDARIRAMRQASAARREEAPPEPPPATGGWSVYTAQNTAQLPGTLVRAMGQPQAGDAAVDEAYDGVAASLALFADVFGRSSYDGEGAHVLATVHYERNYDNAFWDGDQLVFGDGDGRVFGRFTRPVDVLGHELTHAVTQYAAGLAYEDQPGALNESISDVFGSMVKQRMLGQTAADADWLVGEGLFQPGINARGLRDMRAPGTAYDDPLLGKDPQGATMDEYVDTTDDNGGVHLNSGIPNRAFALAAIELGGSSWETAGPIWYAALTSGLYSTTDFETFAVATIDAAPADAKAPVEQAWATVGVLADSTTPRRVEPAEAADVVAVRRTGGFAGLQSYGEVRLGEDPRTSEVEQLLARIDLARLHAGDAQPDRFVYSFTVKGRSATVPEQHLTPELARLVELLLEK